MTKEEAILLLPLIAALAEGKTIQYRSDASKEWKIISDPSWIKTYQYRVEPEEKISYVTVYKTGLVCSPGVPGIGGTYPTLKAAKMAVGTSGSVMELVSIDGCIPFLRSVSDETQE